MSFFCCTFAVVNQKVMANESMEMALMEPEERELVAFILNAIPAEDRGELTADDVLLVLDLMDDYLEEQGLLKEDPQTGEMEYVQLSAA